MKSVPELSLRKKCQRKDNDHRFFVMKMASHVGSGLEVDLGREGKMGTIALIILVFAS